MGLKGKFVAALTIAAVLPLMVGVIVLQSLGYRHLLTEHGQRLQAEATVNSRLLEQALDAEAQRLRGWLAADDVLRAHWTAANAHIDQLDAAALRQETATLDQAWQTRGSKKLIKAMLAQPPSQRLGEFRALSQRVAEIFLTDRSGRVIAASNPTSDYDQADEAWWQRGRALKPGQFWRDALAYDASAKVYSIDLIFAVGNSDSADGVIKMAVDVTPLFYSLRPSGTTGAESEIVRHDGSVLAHLGGNGGQRPAAIDDAAMDTIRHKGHGWLLDTSQGAGRMTGFAPIIGPTGADGPHGYVLISSAHSAVTAPARRNLMWVTASTSALIGLCACAGYVYARRRILQPLATLGNAARSVAASARLAAEDSEQTTLAARREAQASLSEIEHIHSGDEIERLARDFGVMSSRVLRYHSQLEEEVAAKTAAIRADMEMAREFQRTLLPSHYPAVPEAGSPDALRLSFAHFYQAADIVGGDFFDLIQLDQHRAGVLIADVMGHGARSALVSAILRTLVHNEAPGISSPGAFLTELNLRFHEVIAHSGQTLFVTAFFMILDTQARQLAWSVAGHPAPLRALSDGAIAPLWAATQHLPALGLMPHVHYTEYDSALHAGERFLLFTDGVIKAHNASGESFGAQRLHQAFATTLRADIAASPSAIVHGLRAFRGRDTMDDDLCLVVVAVDGVVSAKA